MNYPKRVNRKRRKKQSEATKQDGMVMIDGEIELDGAKTRYFPRRVLQFKQGSAAVVGVVEVERMTKVADLPPLCPPCEARA